MPEAEFTVLVTWDHFAEPGLGMLRAAGCEVLFLGPAKNKAELDACLATRKIDGLVSRTVELDAAALRSCPSLRVVSKHGVGVNNIDVAAATELGIPVTSTPGANSQSVAELTVGLIIAAARRIPWLVDEVRHGRWSRVQDGYQLSGQTLGLVGLGQVGRRVAAVAAALGMDVVAYDPVLAGDPAADGVRRLPRLADLLRVADVLSLHVPLTADTRGMIGADEIALLPHGALVVNTSRGEVLDESALAEGLRTGRLRAAALDTLAVEPVRPDDPLLALDNVFVTPHVGGSTTASVAAVGSAAATNLLAVLRGETVDRRRQVNPSAFTAAGGDVR